ncbi:tautomerase family protein [Metabacillus fastidiosus]|uniref:tautomerase family protein n=1 Tax=Metabacillus fastidiosus TaxID=1458 RepID=UPI002DBE3C05|nr:tautomerase family protein [Metabacillus fastidiosus]
MPFIKISYHEEQYSKKDLQFISTQIMDSLIKEFDVPYDDFFQVFSSHKNGEFHFNPHYLINEKRTKKLLYILITCGIGRTIEQKKKLYNTLTENLYQNNIVAKENVFIILNEIPLENWSFGMGEAQMIMNGNSPTTLTKEDYLNNKEIKSNIRDTLGDLAPAFVDFTENVLFGDLWMRKDLSLRDRSLITLSSLMTAGDIEQLPFHINLAKENKINEDEIIELFTHLAFYTGWPKAASAFNLTKKIFSS